MTGFQHDIAGGSGDLIVTSVQSPNFVSGSAGWQIARDGDAEFNDVVVRGTFDGTDFILNSAGLFIYSGTPANGNLVESITSASGTDQFGNTYQSDITSYGSGFYTQLSAGQLTFTLTGTDTVELVIGDTGILSVQGSAGVAAFDIAVPVSGPIIASSPSNTGVNETWHAMSPLVNSWVNQAGNVTCQYRMVASPPNSVEIIGSLNALAANAATFFTLPAAYRPAKQQAVSAGATGNVGANESPFVQCTTGGALMIGGGNFGGAGSYVFHGFISLDA